MPNLINGVPTIGVVKSMAPSSVKPTPMEAQQSFKTALNDAINKTNQLQVDGQGALEKLIQGQDIDLHEVMIAQQKALVSLQTTVEVRNKVIEAYQEVMRMQV
ncbi:flagellar hook-basal body complex protein FliE [Massilibacterium senegalense]|uniref:flagellar hook-basal body complex protein FliE n=1 Tax=Massilibacterium senegalense TaxID=1632858 RepID=UPI0009E8098E